MHHKVSIEKCTYIGPPYARSPIYRKYPGQSDHYAMLPGVNARTPDHFPTTQCPISSLTTTLTGQGSSLTNASNHAHFSVTHHSRPTRPTQALALNAPRLVRLPGILVRLPSVLVRDEMTLCPPLKMPGRLRNLYLLFLFLMDRLPNFFICSIWPQRAQSCKHPSISPTILHRRFYYAH